MHKRHARCLDSAGITDPDLRGCYEFCRELNQRHGRTYYLSTLMLPPGKRPYVWSLYGFARFADDIVDLGEPGERYARLTRWAEQARTDLARGESDDPACRALAHTMRTWNIPVSYFNAFLDSMLMDLTVTEYATFADLRTYMYGSAAVIGLQMTHILGLVDDEGMDPAATLGEAFQLTNFIRDVGEDLDRGRLYLPLEDLDRFGVSRADLAERKVTRRIRSLLAFEVARTRDLYVSARSGIANLVASSRPCIETATELYGGILDEVVRADYDILNGRVSVGIARRVGVALPAYLRSRRLWEPSGLVLMAGPVSQS